MDADQVLAFRLSRSGLAVRSARALAEAVACPASDFAPDAALLAVAARVEGLSRDAYDHAVDAGDVVVAYAIRGAIHALAPGDLALYGRALIARDDGELAAQLGQQVKRLAAAKGLAPSEALEEVAEATKAALARRPLPRQERAARGAEKARSRRASALVPGLQEPPRRSHAVAVRHGEGGRPAGLRAPLQDGQAGPSAGCARGRSPLPRLLRTGRTRRPGRVGRARKAPCPPPVGGDRRRPRRGARRQEHGLAPERGHGRARVAARRRGHSPDTARRPLSPEAQPAAARSRSQAAQAAVPARREPRGRVEGRPPDRPVARQGERKTAELTVEKLGRLARRDLEQEAQRVAELRGAAKAVVVLA